MKEPIHTDAVMKAWLEKALARDDLGNYRELVVTRFSFLWFAFNAYYSETLIHLIDENRRNGILNENGDPVIPPEIIAIKESMGYYVRRIREWGEYPCFQYFMHRDSIKNILRGNKESHGYGKKPPESIFGNIFSSNPKAKLNGYLNILYSIRCNLFHGQKHCYTEKGDNDDLIVLENAFLCLVLIVSEIIGFPLEISIKGEIMCIDARRQ